MMVAAQALLILSAVTSAGDAHLLYFGASWCEPCRGMQPVVTRLSQAGYSVRSFDIDVQKELAKKYQVTAVPSFVLVNPSGQIIDRIDQATSYEHLRRMLAYYQVAPTIVRGQSSGPSIRTGQPLGEKPLVQTEVASLVPVPEVTSPTLPGNQPKAVTGEAVALAATVRLRVEDATGHSFGTGTVIDAKGQEALVLTCAHIFRESKGKGAVLIDRYDAKNAQPTTGTLISHDLDLDVALVSMKLTRPINVVKLAEASYRAKARDDVYSVGCDHGEPPTVARGQINQINKYLGPANITASGTPIDGRSGGGLFNSQGLLIGVCNAADPEWNEGLYAALPRVYQELDRNGLSFVYQRTKPETRAADPHSAAQLLASSSVKTAPANAIESQVKQTSLEMPWQQTSDNADESEEELVCVLRSDDGGSQAFVIKKPSSMLLEHLRREASNSR